MAAKPTVLVLGVTGQIGKLLAEKLQHDQTISLRVTSRHEEQLPALKRQYGEAVYLDLDDARTFPNALKGVQRAFLLTGYSVSMLTQSKTFVDAAKKPAWIMWCIWGSLPLNGIVVTRTLPGIK